MSGPSEGLLTAARIDMSAVRIDPSWALRIPVSLARRKKVLPCCQIDDRVLVACADRTDIATLDTVERHLEHPIEPILAEAKSLEAVIRETFGGAATQTGTVRVAAGRRDGDEDAVQICEEILQAAALREASDIHIDPLSQHVRVRLRVDGQLEDYRDFSSELHPQISSRIKVLADMDISERRSPQDGRFSWTSSRGESIDVRVATLPTRLGESLTLRLLTSNMENLTLTRLGMDDDDLKTFSTAISRPHGLILLTGPTGSGKSTTLYAAIRELISTRALHVVTVEDPVEYEMDGITQVSVDSADKVSFRKALRSILRNDPDVIMIGEIRDPETADIAIKAALTGHLVFSTLHTNTAAGAVTRLIDMGIQPFLVAATLRLVVAQRLVRRLCQHCRQKTALSISAAAALEMPEAHDTTAWQSGGCIYCAGRGKAGRTALFEMLPVGEAMSHLISNGADEAPLHARARNDGSRSLAEDALRKVEQGIVTAPDAQGAVAAW
jgi:type II secretory ATPase GspE/PulE/Tfp pilus assembly ATPase PilB-like protein